MLRRSLWWFFYLTFLLLLIVLLIEVVCYFVNRSEYAEIIKWRSNDALTPVESIAVESKYSLPTSFSLREVS